ncbi:MAG TPA: hypothetical protein VGM06_09245 [Polyangiaceae bacterium]|jgi:hypothetical protein
MSDRPPLLPLDSELDGLLEAERAAPAPAAALDRVWQRLAAPSAPPGGGARAGGAVGRSLRHAGWLVAWGFVAGTGVGAAGHAALEKRDPPQAPPAAAAPASPAALPEARTARPPEDPASPSSSLAPQPSPTRAAARAVDAPPASSSLAAERALLDIARRDLAQGEAAQALALTETHARRFPHPELAEEREAIAIQALVLEGRSDEARARAAKFRARAPNSLFLPAVEASVASIR